MPDFSLKMYQIQFSPGAPHQTLLGSSRRSSDLIAGFRERGREIRKRGKGKWGEGEGIEEWNKGEGKGERGLEEDGICCMKLGG